MPNENIRPVESQPGMISNHLPYAIVGGIFFASYLMWRPSRDIMFTLSDMLFLVGLSQYIYRRRLPFEPFDMLTPFWMAGIGMVIGGLLIGSIAGPDPSRWPIVASQYLFAWVVLPMILLRRGHEQTVTMLKAYIWGVFAVNLFGAIIYFTYTGTFEEARALFGQDFLSGGRRLGALTGDANWNGVGLTMAVPCAIYLWAKGLAGNILTLVWLVVLMLGIMLSASFTAFASVMIAIALFVIVGGLLPSLRSVLLSLSTAGLVVFVMFERGWLSLPTTFLERVGNAIGRGDISEAGTYEGRLQLIREAWGMVDDHLLIGLGADQYRVVSVLRAPVHNMYLLLWTEGGLISLFGWIIMLGVPVAAAARAYSRDRIAAALTLSVSTTLIIASTASPHMYARLWSVPVLIALAVSLEVMGQEGPVLLRRKKVARMLRAAM